MTVKTPTPQAVSALLKRSGFKRSGLRSDGINDTGGYAVGKVYQGEGIVRVRHYFLSMGAGMDRHRAQLERYAEVITAAGYAAELQDDGRKLIVTAKGTGS
jgi:hypothetical protein